MTLLVAFFVTALIYSSAGFGGGSTYSAILLSLSVPAITIPFISLPCNIVVSGTGCVRQRRNIPRKAVLRILLVSVPAALLGGIVPLRRELFRMLLSIVLLVAGGLSILRGIQSEADSAKTTGTLLPWTTGESVVDGMWIILAGGIIGFVSGMVGIGGGILLSPILQRERSLTPGEITAVSSTFILFNSIAALIGKTISSFSEAIGVFQGIDLLGPVGAVVAGGWIGSGIAVRGMSPASLRVVTGALLVIVALRTLLSF